MNSDQPENMASGTSEGVTVASNLSDNSPGAIGARLKAAREARNESAGDIAHSLKLSVRQIEALESGDYTGLPGPAFVRGFLRNYARYIGIDISEVAVQLNDAPPADSANLTPISNAAGAIPNNHRRYPNLPIGSLVMLLSIIILAGWWFDWFNPNIRETLPAEPNPTASVQAQDATESSPALVEISGPPAPVEHTVPSAPSDGTTTPPSSPSIPEASSTNQTGSGGNPSTPAASMPISTTTTAASGLAALDFSFAGSSWIEVRDNSNTIIYTGTNAAGQTRTVQGTPPFSLVIGNAADVTLKYNGAPVDLAPHTKVAVARLTLK